MFNQKPLQFILQNARIQNRNHFVSEYASFKATFYHAINQQVRKNHRKRRLKSIKIAYEMNGISAQNEPFHRLISIILRHDSVHIILQSASNNRISAKKPGNKTHELMKKSRFLKDCIPISSLFDMPYFE